MVTEIPKIANAHLVVAAFGYWPSFHDAEIKSIRLARAGSEVLNGPILDLEIHAFEMTDRLSPGSTTYHLDKHNLISFRFSEVTELQLDGFNHQNAIFGLSISDMSEAGWEGPRLMVEIESSFGASISFYCVTAAVNSVVPCGGDGEVV